MPDITVTALPAFADNYIWLLSTGERKCVVVDPGDADPVLDELARSGLELDCILLTHHHADHIGGVPRLVAETGASVFGPHDDRIPGLTRSLADDETLELPELELAFRVLEVPGHTSSHIAFFGHGGLFCGDTLFSVGCGRLFVGTAAEMQHSLDKIAELPPETLLFCAHEYTLSNIDFALAVEPDNPDLARRASEAEAARASGRITVPSELGEELKVNPCLRTREATVVEAAKMKDPEARPGATTLAAIRTWKDRF